MSCLALFIEYWHNWVCNYSRALRRQLRGLLLISKGVQMLHSGLLSDSQRCCVLVCVALISYSLV